MKRLVLIPLIALTAVSPTILALTPPYPETQTNSDNNPLPKKFAKKKTCKACKDGKEVTQVAVTIDGSEPVCPDGFEEVKEVQSVDYTLGLGTATYQADNNFVAQDLAAREPAFKSYNPPSTDEAPFSSSLVSEWGRKLVRPVTIGLHAEQITDALFTPSAIELYGGIAGDAWVKKDAAGALRQILTDQCLTNVTTPSADKVLISSYLRSTIGALDSGTGLYIIPANARKFREVLISRPTPTGLDTVDITTTDYSSSETMPKIRGARWVKSGIGPAADWTLSHHTGTPTAQNLISSDELLKVDLGGGLTQRTRTIRKPDSNGNPVVHSIIREKYRDLGNNTLRIVERVEAPGTPEELTTTYTYTDLTGTGTIGLSGIITPPETGVSAANLLMGARLHTMQRSDGYWEQYQYQYNGGTKIMLTEKWSAFKNSAVGDKANCRHTTITLEENSRTVIEEIAGQVVSNEYEKLTLAADGTRTLREERKTGTNVAPLVTEHAYFSDSAAEPNKGRIQYTRHPDGSLTRYTYAIVPDPVTSGQTALKTTVETGAADDAQLNPSATGPVPSLTMGIRKVTITNTFERVVDSKTYDIASGLLLDQAATVTVDAVGRPTHIIHDGDPDHFETFTYACCGVKNHRQPDGSVIDYTKDALDRPTLTTVTVGGKTTATTTAYATETIGARVLPKTTVTRTISAGSSSTGSLLVSESVTNLRGQILVSRSPDADGDGNADVTTYAYSPSTRTSSYTDARGTTTSVYFADGQLASSVTKAGELAITPVTSYDYAPHNENGGGLKTSVSTSGAGTTHSFTDLSDRTFRTESPGYNGATLVSTITFDTRGRATGQSSTGKPATLRVLNALGETTESWVDSNGDGQFNNAAVDGIKDTCRKSSSDYITEDTHICRRTQQWVRNDANADVLVSTTYSSTDGLYQKSVPLAGTGPVTITTATRPINGNSSSVTTIGIGTGSLTSEQSMTLNADGTTTVTSIQKDTARAVITSSSSTADLQGRAISQTGERGLITTYSDFTAAGRALGVTSQGTYTKTTLDSQGRVTQTVTKQSSNNTVISTVNTGYSYATDGGLFTVQHGTNTYPTLTKQDIYRRTVELRTFRESNLAFVPTASTTGGDKTTWNYEATTGLLLSKRDNADKGATYTYTADGKLLTRTWARGVVTTYDYTPAGQLKTTDYSDSTPDVTISYDRLGRPLTQTNGLAASDFTYDPATLALDKETITYTLPGQSAFTRILDRSQDALGRPTGYSLGSAGVPPASGGILPPPEAQATYGYSATTGRLETVSNGTSSFRYDYLANSSLLEHVVATSGAVHDVHLAYEPTRNVLATRQNKVGTNVISQYDYTVNSIGQRSAVAQVGTAFQAVRAIAWQYDSLGQVIQADSNENTHDRAYQFDTIGNRKKTSNTLTLPGTDNWGVNPLNQLTKVNGEDLPADSYDSDGNQINAKVLPLGSSSLASCVYSWDAENRLISATVNGSTTTYHYDAQSRRICTQSPISKAQSTLYIYDGWNVAAEYSISNSQYQISKSYLWGLDLSGSMQGAGGVGGLLSVSLITNNIISDNFFPTFDGSGNVSEYLTATGSIAAHYEYDSFGNTTVATGTQASDFAHRFSTRPLDAITGLYYYGYRFYDPLTGRWPSRDPIEEQGGINLYGFVENDGIQGIDLLGLWELKFAFDKTYKLAGRGFISINARADLKNGTGVVEAGATGGARFFITEMIPGLGPVGGTALGLLLERAGVHQEGRISLGGVAKVECNCPDEETAIQCTLVSFKLRIQAQLRLGYQGSNLRLFGSVAGGGQYDVVTGVVSLFGSAGVRGQAKGWWGGWYGFQYGDAGETAESTSLPVPFKFPAIGEQKFQIPLGVQCKCMKNNVNGDSFLGSMFSSIEN